jgi:hypothetical protein
VFLFGDFEHHLKKYLLDIYQPPIKGEQLDFYRWEKHSERFWNRLIHSWYILIQSIHREERTLETTLSCFAMVDILRCDRLLRAKGGMFHSWHVLGMGWSGAEKDPSQIGGSNRVNSFSLGLQSSTLGVASEVANAGAAAGDANIRASAWCSCYGWRVIHLPLWLDHWEVESFLKYVEIGDENSKPQMFGKRCSCGNVSAAFERCFEVLSIYIYTSS